MRINCPITTLDNDHLKLEPFIPFLEKVSSAIDGALVELVPQGRGIVSIELLKEEKPRHLATTPTAGAPDAQADLDDLTGDAGGFEGEADGLDRYHGRELIFRITGGQRFRPANARVTLYK